MTGYNPYLQVEGLSKSFGDLVLFENLSLGIAEGQKIGLIAKNGTGKSTLLNIITGKEGKDAGTVIYRNNIKVGYLEQHPQYNPEMRIIQACFSHGNTITQVIERYEECMETPGNPELEKILEDMERLKAWDYEQRVKQILSQLKITQFDQVIGELSGGQLKRVALANVLIMEPDLLILDEPTNHLDLEIVEWLEDYLRRSTLSLLMVTHDRYFLDRVCDVIYEIDDRQIYTYKGNYSYYLEKRQERLDALASEITKANNLYRTELDWMRRMPQARGHKARYREENFYKLEKVAKQHIQNENIQLNMNSSYIGNKIFDANNLCKRWGDKIILDHFSYIFSRYEKMGIIGDNGTGKSTFIKILQGLVPLDSGVLEIGETVRFGYYSQEGLKFREDQKVIDIITEIADYIDMGDGHRLSAMQLLQHFLFSPEKQHTYVYKLSGGEKRRLYLCSVLMHNPNFLILDEPTNDLDILTLQILEDYLQHFKGCVIVVSHDRYFMDKVVDHLMVFNGQGDIRDFPGNYTEYRGWKDRQIQEERLRTKEVAGKTTDAASSKVRQNEKRRLTFKEKKELEKLEADISQLESEKKEIEAALCGGTNDVNIITTFSKRLPILNEELDEKSMRWLELSEFA